MSTISRLKAFAAAIRPMGFAALVTTNCLYAQQVQAFEKLSPDYSFNGFGTLGAVYSDENQADYVSSWLLQPNGAGHTSEWHAGVDTKLGAQLDIQLNDALSGVIQVVVQRHEDNSWAPKIEWANIKYQFNDNLSLRLGRKVLPNFMVSDTRLVGYANPWIRGPQEVYQLNPLTNLDGLDVVYTQEFDNGSNTLEFHLGQTDRNIVQGGKIRGRNGILINNTIEYDFVTLRFSYLQAKLDLTIRDSTQLLGALSTIGDTLSFIPGQENNSAQAKALSTRYLIKDTPVEVFSVGVKLEPGNWMLMGEWARVTETGALAEVQAGYATIAYRFSSLMPFLTFAEVNGNTPNEPGLSTAGMPPPLATAANTLNQGLNALLFQVSAAQKSATVGLRWDFHPGAALKLQYQHIEIDNNSPGRLGNIQPGFTPGGTVNVFSTAIDFVF